MTEGYIKTVVEHVRKVTLTNHRDLDNILLLFLPAYRVSTLETTDMSVSMVIGREQCLP
jgi:hypothetical protein